MSEHPLADVIVTEAKREGLDLLSVKDFRQIPGLGIMGQIKGKQCLAGNRRLLQIKGILGGSCI